MSEKSVQRNDDNLPINKIEPAASNLFQIINPRFTIADNRHTISRLTFGLLLTFVVLTCFLFSNLPIDAQETPQDKQTQPLQPSDNANTQSADGTNQNSDSAKEILNPETMTPDPETVLGDGDEVILLDNLVQIHGNALIKYEDVVLRADHVWADFNDNIMRAAGNVYLKVGNEETYSDELVFNLETKKGIARNGYTFSDPWYFGGSEIFKIEDNKSYIRGGSLTTCSLKHPHYHFSVSEVIIKMNQEMIAKNIVLRIGGIPLFYFPAIRRDLRKGKVAKIIVRVGTDSYQGPNIGIILPIARKRRYDGALLYDRSARRGQGYGFEGKYRFNDTQFKEIYVP
ncbi:LPS-assembly protein LptD, partial [Candidatus Poribacteria bacterium]|nr:LPS-assembly protein LptD [Candidatus Poribacteria bacterium]